MLIVGDVHGSLNLLKSLIENIVDDDIYFVGDLIDRGKENIETLKFVMDKGYKVVIGNHEKMMLDYLTSRDREVRRLWFGCGGKKTYKEYTYKTSKEEQKKILNYLKSLPYYIYLEDKDILISHAGLKGSRGTIGYFIDEERNIIRGDSKEALRKLIDMQKPDDFIWTRELFISNKSFIDFDTVFIAGHTPTSEINFLSTVPKIIKFDNRFLIDCGSFYTGVLGALQIKDNKVTAHYYSEENGYYFEDLGNLR